MTAEGVINMLEATRLYVGDDAGSVRFHQASSSEMFGKVPTVPQTEQPLLWLRSPHGLAKVSGHYMTINYRESCGMHTSSGMLVNHELPRRGRDFVTRKIVGQWRGSPSIPTRSSCWATSTPSATGRFAGDYVEAMGLMLQQEIADDYVSATGESHSVREFLNVASHHVGSTTGRPTSRSAQSS